MRADRLLKLADFLGTLDDKLFDMNQWRSPCGTVACAMGWAATIPEFAEAGLKLDREYSYPEFDYYAGFGAAAAFFEISYDDAVELFSSSGYFYYSYRGMGGTQIKPSHVAQNIRDYVDDKKCTNAS
jgi:hypothetical protein